MPSDSYHIIEREATVETKVQGSRFIGESCLASSVDEALDRLQIVRKREHAATHHCFAFQIDLFKNVQFKYSDDGEPSGTAGKSIYDVLCGWGVTNTLVVVTRYFGGTKLGTGGLARAYSHTARACLEASGKRQQFVTDQIRIIIEFSLYDRLTRLIQKYEAKPIQTDYSDVVNALVGIRRSRVEAFTRDIVELSGGKAVIDVTSSPS